MRGRRLPCVVAAAAASAVCVLPRLGVAAFAVAAAPEVQLLHQRRVWALGLAPHDGAIAARPAVIKAQHVAAKARLRLCSASGGLAALCAAVAAGAAAIVRASHVLHPHATEKNLGYRIQGAPGHPGSPHTWTEPIRWCHRFKRRIKNRKKVEGTTARPRVAVFRSLDHMHVNVVDDTTGIGVTIFTSTTKQKDNLDKIRQAQGVEPGKERTWSMDAAEVIGQDVAKRCLEKNITMIVFDRGGFPYKGRVKALAEAARSGGLQF